MEIKKFYLGEGGRLRGISDYFCTGDRDASEHIFELNDGCPGGWWYSDYIARITLDCLRRFGGEELANSLSSSTKLLTESLGDYFISEARVQNREKIFIVAVDTSLLVDTDEDYKLFKYIEKFFPVEICSFQEFYVMLLDGSLDSSEILTFQDFTMEEVHKLSLSSSWLNEVGHDSQKITQNLKNWKQFGIFAITDLNLSERGWAHDLRIEGKHDMIPSLISYQDLRVIESLVYDNGELLDLSKWVLKLEGTFGGVGVMLPGNFDSSVINKFLDKGVEFWLEPFVIQPTHLQPLAPKDFSEGSPLEPSSYLGKFTIDIRTVFLVDSHGDMSFIGLIGRSNFPHIPDNISSGGMMVPLFVCPDNDFEGVKREIGSFFSQFGEENMLDYMRAMEKIFISEGVTIYNRALPVGPIPYVISESSIKKAMECARIVHEAIKQQGKSEPFIFALDMSILP